MTQKELESIEFEWVRLWLRAVRAAYKLAFGETVSAMKGKRVRAFDDRGLHPVSEQWGRITLAESHEPVGQLIADRILPPLSPASLTRMAQEDGRQEFVKKIREESNDADSTD